MTISFDILGDPGRDNALLVRVDSGQSVERVLFDCGQDCLDGISFSDVQAIDHLCFSHLHMDHVAGFDHYFRSVFDRNTKANQIWGPPRTSRILQHRFQGFLWNLNAEMSGTWRVTDISENAISTSRFELSEAFEIAHDEGARIRQPILFAGSGYVVEAYTMDHRTPTIAYVVRENSRRNIDTVKLAEMGLKPGQWMKVVKDELDVAETVLVNGQLVRWLVCVETYSWKRRVIRLPT